MGKIGKLAFFIINLTLFNAQIPLDSISYEYFERDRIQLVNSLYKEIRKDANPWIKVQLAENYSHVNKEDSAVKYYDIALEQFESKNDSNAMRMILPELISCINSQNIARFTAKEYRNMLKELSHNLPIYNRYSVFLKKMNASDSIESDNFQEAIKILWNLKNNFNPEDSLTMYSAILSNIAICKQRIPIKEWDSAFFYYNQANLIDKKIPENNNVFYNYLNLSILFRRQEQNNKALLYLDSAEMNPPHKWKLKSYRILYKNYNKTHKALGNSQKALAYLEAANKITDITNEIEQNRIIAEIETKHAVKQTQAKLNLYEKFIHNYRRYKIYYIIGLIVTFLLSLYSFVRWKQEDVRRKKIEIQKQQVEQEKQRMEKEKQFAEEQKQRAESEKQKIQQEHQFSLQEISDLKKLVEKEHIVLRNKSKVHLEDLLYIQSDGHYLQLFTQKGKEFVRGKLSEMLQQLPPNFAQCHRSYIVNKNYIHYTKGNSIFLKNETEIPVSRKYKPDFEK